MSVSTSDVKFRKSSVVTDTVANGNVAGSVEVLSGIRHNLFPRVTKAERTAGITRHRKQFWSNENTGNDIAYGSLVFLEHPSNGGDRFYLAKGTHSDTQSDILSGNALFTGVGALNALLTAGETSVSLLMENNDYAFPNGGKLHISDKFLVGQTVEASAKIGDSVVLVGGTWEKTQASQNITYPNGMVVDTGVVMTTHASYSEEWVDIADKLTAGEVIASGDGATSAVVLSALSMIVNGVSSQEGKLPVITATCGGLERTVNVGPDGACTGYCSAGQLDMVTGAWTTDIIWLTAPDNAVDILATYHDLPYSYVGSVVTVELDSQVANAYAVADTFASGCISGGDIEASVSLGAVVTVGGVTDMETNPITGTNLGTVEDTFTITFTGPSTFSVAGSRLGALPVGSIAVEYAPTDGDGNILFKIPTSFWSGSWLSAETVTFSTSPADLPIWLKEVVPAGTAQESYNLVVLGWYCE